MKPGFQIIDIGAPHHTWEVMRADGEELGCCHEGVVCHVIRRFGIFLKKQKGHIQAASAPR